MTDRPPHWAKPLCADLAELCGTLDSDEHHAFRDDVVDVFPEMRDPYVKMCPRRTHLTHMKAVATRMDYAKSGVETAKTASWSPAASRPARGAASTAGGTRYHSSPAGACDMFLADCQLVHDNCVLFNGGPETPLGTVARDFLKRASLAVRELADRYTGSRTPALNTPSSQEQPGGSRVNGSAVATRSAVAAASSSTLPTQRSSAPTVVAAPTPLRTRNAAAAAVMAPEQPLPQHGASGTRQLRGSGAQPAATPLAASIAVKRERAEVQPPQQQQRQQQQRRPPQPADTTAAAAKPEPVPEPPRLPDAIPRPAPPREQYPVALSVPQALRAALVAEQLQQFGSSSTAVAAPVVPVDDVSRGDGADDAFAAYRKALSGVAENGAMAAASADTVLTAFAAHTKVHAPHGAPGQRGVKLEDAGAAVETASSVDAIGPDAAECAEVVDRVLRPAFNRCAYNCALFPRERVKVLAVAAGSLRTEATSSSAAMIASLAEGRVDLTTVLGVLPLVRFLVVLPSIAAKVLDVSLPRGPAGTDGRRAMGAVSRIIVPVVEALLRFIATTQAPFTTAGDAA